MTRNLEITGICKTFMHFIPEQNVSYVPGSIPSVFGESAGANMVTYLITTLLEQEKNMC